MMIPQVIDKVDARGLACPLPTVRLSQAIRNIGIGEVLELWADDPASENNMIAWAKSTGHELLYYSNADGIFQFQFRRAK